MTHAVVALTLTAAALAACLYAWHTTQKVWAWLVTSCQAWMITANHIRWVTVNSRLAQYLVLGLAAGVALAVKTTNPLPLTLPGIILAAWCATRARRLGFRAFATRIILEARLRMRWESAMYNGRLDIETIGLDVLWRGDRKTPRIRRVVHDRHNMTVYAERMGQPDKEWIGGKHLIAGELHKADGYQYDKYETRTVRLVFPVMVGDADPYTVDAPDDVNLDAVPVGRDATHRPVTINLRESHLFVGGKTRSGKSGFGWGLLKQLAPAIRSGRVRVVAIDPKAVELGYGARLFYKFIGSKKGNWHEDVEAELDAMITRLEDRKAAMFGTSRKHVPSPDDPMYILFIEEMLAFLALLPDATTRKRIMGKINAILAVGTGLGVNVVAFTQSASKEIIPNRNLYNVRIQFAATDVTEVQMIFGQNAAALAPAHLIPSTAKGVGYAYIEGQHVRFRASFEDDAAVKQLEADYAAPVEEHHHPTVEPDIPHQAEPTIIPPPAAAPSKKETVSRWLGAHAELDRKTAAEHLVAEFGCSRSTAYDWWNKYPRIMPEQAPDDADHETAAM